MANEQRWTKRDTIRERASLTSAAFIIESILLFVFLSITLAILISTFFASFNKSMESGTTDKASAAASQVAEQFAASPTQVRALSEIGDLVVTCSVSDDARRGGTMYKAVINVYKKSDAQNSKSLYTISTERYESEVS